MKIVSMDPEKCVGCRNCEYACSFINSDDFDRKEARIRVSVFPNERVCLPLACVHCSEPFCMEVCPSGAIEKDDLTGAITIDPNRCVGCKMCILACPFGHIYFNAREQVSQKCDLCSGEPNCVKFCISGALQFVETEEAYQSNREQFITKLKTMLEKKTDEGEAK